MKIGDKVFTVGVSDDRDGPLVLIHERTVTAIIDEGVVCKLGANCSVYPKEKLFSDRAAANARAVDLIRVGLARITRRYTEAIDKLLTSQSAVV